MHDADSSYTTSKVFSAFNRIPKKWNSYGEPGIKELFIITNGMMGDYSRGQKCVQVFVLNVNNRS